MRASFPWLTFAALHLVPNPLVCQVVGEELEKPQVLKT